ncbi:cobalamin synthase [Halostagnicola sp. A56]|uniref:adenosylcobinamide-GDP ribazoletransferase n=1 Tax=Halostagnicola sp. A56 TaxID=1495067 RepID=UPI00049FC9B9|nr:adenosylcobinamide-GDP ribazoletransferase [Halostagnicola sp. A56]KDE59074.1 cobalamin synthase [Halostagnicola sp. A56]
MDLLPSALRGALGFLTRLPISQETDDWEAFLSSPWTFPLVGYLVGWLVAIPVLLTDYLPAATVALAYPLAVYAVTGIHHLDGVADLGDALVVHGDLEKRRAVLSDTTTGVGAILAVSVVVAGLAFGALALADLRAIDAVGIVLVAEIATKLGLAAMATLGSTEHEGMGKSLTDAVSPLGFVVPLLIAVAVIGLTWPTQTAAVTAVGALLGTAFAWALAGRYLGGISGDIFGAANEIGRVAGVHAGVIAWMLL